MPHTTSAPTPTAATTATPNHEPKRRQSIAGSLEGQRGTLLTSGGKLHGNVGIRDRLHHFTWAWFTTTMSTGGIALVLNNVPHRFNGLKVLGEIVFIFDLILFVTFTTLLTTRFIFFPNAFLSSLQHPTESLFVPTFFISIVNIVSNIQIYGVPHCGPWLITALCVFFWIYTTVTFLVAVGEYFFLYTGKPFTMQNMTPQWILPVFPVMLCGTLASEIGGSQPPEHALPILIAGVTFQGLGMMIATFMYGPYLARLMTSGLPSPSTRPGMFITVGPPSFTGLALLGISSHFSALYPSYSSISGVQHPEIIADVLRIVALCVAIFLWATTFWFFGIALVSVVAGMRMKEEMTFHLAWWALVFPNVGFTIATIQIGRAVMSEGILWVGSVMTILLVATWLFVGAAHARAVWKRQILWPGKDEDHDQ